MKLSNELEKIAEGVKNGVDGELNMLFRQLEDQDYVEKVLEWGIKPEKIQDKKVKKALLDVKKALGSFYTIIKQVEKTFEKY